MRVGGVRRGVRGHLVVGVRGEVVVDLVADGVVERDHHAVAGVRAGERTTHPDLFEQRLLVRPHRPRREPTLVDHRPERVDQLRRRWERSAQQCGDDGLGELVEDVDTFGGPGQVVLVVQEEVGGGVGGDRPRSDCDLACILARRGGGSGR